MHILLTLSILLLSGCAFAMGGHEMMDASKFMGAPHSPTTIQIIEPGMPIKVPCVRVAKIGAGGNGYATKDTLYEALRNEARKIGADAVLISNLGVSKGTTVSTYGGGVALSNAIELPYVNGFACRLSKVDPGFRYDRDNGGLIDYVYPNSPASKVGIVEGDRLIGINGQPLRGDHTLFEKEVLVKQPGERVTLEWLTRDDVKFTKEMILEKPRAGNLSIPGPQLTP